MQHGITSVKIILLAENARSTLDKQMSPKMYESHQVIRFIN